MPYAIVENDVIKNVYLKPNIFARLKPSERLVEYNPPDVDLNYYTIVPVKPIVGDAVEFRVEEKPNASIQRLEDFLAMVDSDVDKFYRSGVGAKEPEYRLAEQDALNFKTTGFAGDAPLSVSSYAAAENLSNEVAAETILQKAADWRNLLIDVRAKRMEVKGLAKSGSIEQAFSVWSSFYLPLIS